MLRLGIDLDGVIYDFHTAFRKYVAKKKNKDVSELPMADTWFFFEEQWDMSLDEYLMYIDTGVRDKEIFWRGDPIPDSLYGVSELYRQGHDIVLITARGSDLGQGDDMYRHATEYWVNSQGFPYHELILDHDKTKYDLDLLIDDSGLNALSRKEKGLDTLIFSQPWNLSYQADYRVENWIEAVEFVKEFSYTKL